jgi:S1-C subfamily serine protease
MLPLRGARFRWPQLRRSVPRMPAACLQNTTSLALPRTLRFPLARSFHATLQRASVRASAVTTSSSSPSSSHSTTSTTSASTAILTAAAPPVTPPVVPHLQPLDSAHTDVLQHNHVLESLVKIYTTASSPNYLLPWQQKPNRGQICCLLFFVCRFVSGLTRIGGWRWRAELTGSGFIIEGRRILTNAHVVADQKYIQVSACGGGGEGWGMALQPTAPVR